jgi:hypothetical protein
MSGHQWGAVRMRDGKQACLHDGCAVRRIRHSPGRVVWQAKPRSRWVLTTKAPIPPCAGMEAALCTHVERAPVALGRGHTVVGGFKVGQCQRPALPGLVVCEHHATPDALRMVILAMDAEIQRLKQLPDTSPDNPSGSETR